MIDIALSILIVTHSLAAVALAVAVIICIYKD